MRLLAILAALILIATACSQATPADTSAPETAAPTLSASTAPTTLIALPRVSGAYPEPDEGTATQPSAPAATVVATQPPPPTSAVAQPTSAPAAQPGAIDAPTATPASVIALPGVSGAYPESNPEAPEATVVPDAEITATVEGQSLRLLVVADPETRRRGLMFYRSLPDDVGMLFVFPLDGQLSFWMRNTYIPLSVAYLDAEGRILNIADMQPLDDQTFHPSAGPARYALEVNQGWFAARNIGAGAVVEFSLPPDLVVR